MDVNENLRNLSQSERNKIKYAVQETWAKMRPNTVELDYLYTLFKENVDPTFQGNCHRCRKKVTTFWRQSLKNWGMI